MDLNQFFSFFTRENIIFYSFKPIALIFSFFYLLFSLVILKQTEAMNKTINTRKSLLIKAVSLFQFLLSFSICLLGILLL